MKSFNGISVAEESNGLIVYAYTSGPMPTDANKFALGAMLVGYDAVYTNTGTVAVPVWTDITSISQSELPDPMDLTAKTLQLPTATPVNPIASQGVIDIIGDVIEGEIITIGTRVYEIDSDGVVGSGHVAIDVSGGATAATATVTMGGVVSDAETLTINGRVYEFDADSSITGDVAIDISAGTKTQATTTLDITGVVIAGETFTIGSETFELEAGQVLTGSNIGIDITAGMTQSQGTLTLGGALPSAGEKVIINSVEYVWAVAPSAPLEVKIGAYIDDCIDAIVAAVNADAGLSELFGAGTTANTDVVATKGSGTTAIFTAIIYGTVGDAITTTDTMADVANIFDAVTLGTTTAGVDCPAADADGYIITDFNGGTAYAITASQGAGTTVDFDADALGAQDGSVGNLASTQTMANATFTGATMTGGSDATANEASAAFETAVNGDGSAEVTAVDGTGSVVVTAIEEGTLMNGKVTAESTANCTWGGNLAGGTDEGATAAVTSIALAITNDASAVVTAVDSTGDTVLVTAKVGGTSGDLIVFTTDFSNATCNGGGVLGATTAGVDGTVGVIGEFKYDSSYLWVCTDVGTSEGSTWKKATLA